MEKALVGRQPIFDKAGNIYAYELFFRNSGKNRSAARDNRYATAKVLSDSFNTFGLERIVGNRKAMVSVDREFLLDDVVETIPAERFILKILDPKDADDDVIERITRLKERGYLFAIADTDIQTMREHAPLYESVDFAKIDFSRSRDIGQLKEKMDLLSRFGPQLLAEKIEDGAMHEYGRRLGFSYFQGYFFAAPKILESKTIEPNHASLIKIIEKINGGCSVSEIEDTFNHSPDLTVNMLRYINSSHFNTKKEISSIPQAVNMIGRHALVQWLTLSLYSSSENNRYKESILQSVMLRAEAMLSLAKRYKLGMETANKAYLIGLLSLLHVLLHIPRKMIFHEIPFDKEIVDAVLHHDGKLGKFLKIVTIIEAGHIPTIQAVLAKIRMDEEELGNMLSTCYVNVINRNAAL